MKIPPTKAPRPHSVVVETSILFQKDKTPAVNPAVDKFYEGYSKIADLRLFVPEVVREEILYQQALEAQKALSNAQNELSTVKNITQKEYRIRVSSDRIVQLVTEKFDNWMRLRKATLIQTPFDVIDWVNICKAAVWRLNTFAPDEKHPYAERGFRDALIVETVVNYVKNHKDDSSIAFVCNDRTLRNTVVDRLRSKPDFSGYESLSDLGTYLKLAHEKLTSKFIKAILSRARKKFFSKGDPHCLYYKHKVREQVHTKFKSLFDNPEESGQTLAERLLYLKMPDASQSLATQTWTKEQESTWYISNPSFLELFHERYYHWENKIHLAVKYTRHSEDILLPTKLLPISSDRQSRVLFLEFSVKWQAEVRRNGSFHNVSLEDIELVSHYFRFPTPEEVEEYRLDFGRDKNQ